MMQKTQTGRALRALAALFLTWTSVALAMVVPLTLADLTSQTELIVRGEVAQLASERDVDGAAIFTIVTVDVGEVIFSRSEEISPEGRIAFRIEGGTIGGETMATSISPTFTEGEEAVFFLMRENGDELLTLVGGPQGVYPIEDGRVRGAGQDRPLRDFLQEVIQLVQ